MGRWNRGARGQAKWTLLHAAVGGKKTQAGPSSTPWRGHGAAEFIHTTTSESTRTRKHPVSLLVPSVTTHKAMLHRTNFSPSTHTIHNTPTRVHACTLFLYFTQTQHRLCLQGQFPPSPHIWENKSQRINLALPPTLRRGASPTSTLFGFWFPEQAGSKHSFSEAINHPFSYLLSLTPGFSATPCSSSFK